MSKTAKFAHPLIVARASSLSAPIEDLLTKPTVITQDFAIRQLAIELGRDLKPVTLIKRTQSKFDPASNTLFLNVLASCGNGLDIVLIDDFLRLIDSRDLEAAIDQGAYLQASAKPLFSIAHASFVSEINPNFLAASIQDRVRKSMLRSRSVKKGLKENEARYGANKPTRKAIDKAAKVKSILADHKAQNLFPKIERIRILTPLETRANHKALADALNEAGVATPSGRGRWQGTSVKRILDRIECIEEAAPK